MFSGRCQPRITGQVPIELVLRISFVWQMWTYVVFLYAGTFRGRSADYLWMLVIGVVQLDVLASLWPLDFLSNAMTAYMVRSVRPCMINMWIVRSTWDACS